MKKTITLFTLLLSSVISSAQVVGDASVFSVDYSTNSSLLYMGSSQGYPKLIYNQDVQSVVWATNTQPVLLRQTSLGTNYLGINSDDVTLTTGNQNTTSGDLQHVVKYDANSGKYLSIYKHNFYQGANKDYSLKGVLYDGINYPATPFYIEGPFQYSSDAPSMPSIAVNENSIFCVAYHSSLTSGTTSKVKVKFVDASTGSITPSATSGTQNGIELTFQGAQHPSVAWNQSAGVFGIVYTTGSGNNQKIKFVSCDASGNVVTAQKDLIADNQIQVQYPKIYADGNNFVIVWRDYREIIIGNNAPVTGIPAMRIAQIDAVGDLIVNNGAADLFDVNDNSLLISNPYFSEAYYEYDLKVITPGQKYAVVWGTQNVVPSIEYATVEVVSSTMKSSYPKTISNNGSNSFGPSIAYDAANSEYLVTYYEHNGTNYENRITHGVQSTTIDPVGIEELEINVRLYPNPTSDIFKVEGIDASYDIEIYTLAGHVVFKSNVNNGSDIDVSELISGVYLVKLKNENGSKIIRLIKK